ncbi:MAG: TIGR03564 family F420-dependent LLM class oxidoreductase [Pseudomonadales bacterium]
MRIGLMMGASPGEDGSLDGVMQRVKTAEADGFDNVWMANVFGLDAINTLSIAGRETTRIGLGTAVVPSYPRHPTAMAQQAMTAAVAADGRFTLGIGLSHKMVIEDMFGMSYAKPAKHMREYLSVLVPLLKGEGADFDGENYRVHAKMDVPNGRPVPLVVAALGPAMLKIAGEMTDGTNTWMTGPVTLEEHIIPTINAAASAQGRPTPRIVAGLFIVLTADVDAAKAKLAKNLEIYAMLPSYRAMLDREGAAGPADVAIVGDEQVLRAALQRLRAIGVTDFNAVLLETEAGAGERTYAFLKSELG